MVIYLRLEVVAGTICWQEIFGFPISFRDSGRCRLLVPDADDLSRTLTILCGDDRQRWYHLAYAVAT